jgi:hypothetical protein
LITPLELAVQLAEHVGERIERSLVSRIGRRAVADDEALGAR